MTALQFMRINEAKVPAGTFQLEERVFFCPPDEPSERDIVVQRHRDFYFYHGACREQHPAVVFNHGGSQSVAAAHDDLPPGQLMAWKLALGFPL